MRSQLRIVRRTVSFLSLSPPPFFCWFFAGECNFELDDHPVAYSALNSHATYPTSTLSNVYFQYASNSILSNLLAISLADRTFRGAKYFDPTVSGSVVYLNRSEFIEPTADIQALIQQRLRFDPSPSEDWKHLGPSWAAFSGFLGVTSPYAQRSMTGLNCFYQNREDCVELFFHCRVVFPLRAFRLLFSSYVDFPPLVLFFGAESVSSSCPYQRVSSWIMQATNWALSDEVGSLSSSLKAHSCPRNR